MSPTHWLLRVGNGNHYMSSSSKKLWGIDSIPGYGKYFVQTAKEGDLLWFVKTGGLLIGVATFVCTKKRECGPLISFTLSDEELGWTEREGTWDTEVHYKDLYNIEEVGLIPGIKSPLVIRKYSEKCKLNLPDEYQLIVRYSKAIKTT